MATNLLNVVKATKHEARYTPDGTMEEHCGICRYFYAGNHGKNCDRVEGHVVHRGWCKFFSKDPDAGHKGEHYVPGTP